MARLDRSAFTMLVEKASFVLMRIIVALCLFIVGIFFILVPFDLAIRLAQYNLLSWAEHLEYILRQTGESVAIGGAMLVWRDGRVATPQCLAFREQDARVLYSAPPVGHDDDPDHAIARRAVLGAADDGRCGGRRSDYDCLGVALEGR